MKILAFDNSTSTCVVALQSGERTYSKSLTAPMQQAKLILPAIDSILNEAQLKLKELDAIAFGCGPGSFTGVRIATSVAQGLAFAAELPLIPVSSLALLAQSAVLKQTCSSVQIMTDARMGEVYYAHYDVVADNIVQLNGAEEIKSRDTIKNTLDSINNTTLYVGDGWTILNEELLNGRVRPVFEVKPCGNALLLLANNLYLQRKTVVPIEAFPVYLR